MVPAYLSISYALKHLVSLLAYELEWMNMHEIGICMQCVPCNEASFYSEVLVNKHAPCPPKLHLLFYNCIAVIDEKSTVVKSGSFDELRQLLNISTDSVN